MSSEDARTKLMALRQELLDLSDAARDDRKPSRTKEDVGVMHED